MASIDWSATGLRLRMRFELLNRSLESVDFLDGVRSFSMEANMYNDFTGGEIDISHRKIDVLTDYLIRPWITAQLDGVIEEYPLMTGYIVAGARTGAGIGAKESLKIFDRTKQLDNPLARGVSISAGADPFGFIRGLLEERVIYDAAITEDGSTLSSGLSWGPAVTYRRAVNDILDAIGYRAIWADEWGRLHCVPYVLPQERPVLHYLLHGETCTYKNDFSLDVDSSETPTAVLLVQRSPDDGLTAPLVANHSIDPPASGLVVTYVEEDVEAADQGTLDVKAAAKLQDLAYPARKLEVSWRWQPRRVQEVAYFFHPGYAVAPIPGGPPVPADPLSMTAVITGMSLKYADGRVGHVTGSLREIRTPE